MVTEDVNDATRRMRTTQVGSATVSAWRYIDRGMEESVSARDVLRDSADRAGVELVKGSTSVYNGVQEGLLADGEPQICRVYAQVGNPIHEMRSVEHENGK